MLFFFRFPRVDDAGTYKVMVLGPAVEDMAGKYKCQATVDQVVYENSLEILIKGTDGLIEQ